MAETLQSALVKALSDMPNPVKNAENPAFKRGGRPMKYADLEATLDACKPVLAACGIALMQYPVSTEHGLGVHTWLIGHGETLDCGEFVLPLEGQTPQKAAGAITYARRYALVSLFGLAQEDDDGNTASAPTTRQAAPAADDVKEAYATVMSIAEFNDKKDAVKHALGDPKDGRAALAAFRALDNDGRALIERIASGEEAA